MPEPLEVGRELEALRARVRASEVPPSPQLSPLQKAISGVNANWHLSARFPAPVNAPLAWRAVYFAKSLPRRLMVELLNLLVDQQNAVNAQVARALTELAKENAELKARVEELERQANSK
jgi:hypothetical protein